MALPCLSAIAGALPPDYLDTRISATLEKQISVDADGNFDPKPINTMKWVQNPLLACAVASVSLSEGGKKCKLSFLPSSQHCWSFPLTPQVTSHTGFCPQLLKVSSIHIWLYTVLLCSGLSFGGWFIYYKRWMFSTSKCRLRHCKTCPDKWCN